MPGEDKESQGDFQWKAIGTTTTHFKDEPRGDRFCVERHRERISPDLFGFPASQAQKVKMK